MYTYLVGGFPYIGNVIIPTDGFILFRWVGQPPTRKIAPRWTEISSSPRLKKRVAFANGSSTEPFG